MLIVLEKGSHYMIGLQLDEPTAARLRKRISEITVHDFVRELKEEFKLATHDLYRVAHSLKSN